jgi:hypothetical protein
MNQYERSIVVHQIHGYFIPRNFASTEEDTFNNAKKELLENLQKHIDNVKGYSYTNWISDTR